MKRVLIEPNRYFDSVFLMRISRQLEELPGIHAAIVSMGTPANIENLVRVGFSLPESQTIGPSDLAIAIDADDEAAAERATAHLGALLKGERISDGIPGSGHADTPRPTTLRRALELLPDANLALISVPGDYAAREARLALANGLHVMLFSDNVSVEDEVALKEEAIERGLLMMGPDCGTAILNGVPLGFANVTRRGSVGIVGASGTGIQEISSLVHRLGGGISQAIGTGGRDLSSDVGAAMTRFGIDALAHDPNTEVIVVVSKAPAPCVIPAILDGLRDAGKPAVAHFVGWDPAKADKTWLDAPVQFAGTLDEAARLACIAVGIDLPTSAGAPVAVPAQAGTAKELSVQSRRVLGLFCGGTLCQEAWSLMNQAGIDVVSNVAFDPAKKIHPQTRTSGNVLLDLGDDVFTVGKPHPMIEPSLRDERVAQAGSDPEIGIVLVDCVLGYGAHADPAGSLAAAATRAKEAAEADGRELTIIASVTGTDLDPQNADEQRRKLRDAGVIVAESNAAAVRTAIDLFRSSEGGSR